MSISLRQRAGSPFFRQDARTRPRPDIAADTPQPLNRDPTPITSRLRAARRGLLIFCLTPPSMVVQAVCLRLPGAAKTVFPKIYWAMFARILGLRVRRIGAPIANVPGRPVIFVSNHSSWVDIPVIGGVLPARFISKGDVARWPVIRTIAHLGRTLFVSRQRNATGRERDELQQVLIDGDNLILFPEGTSSDGSRVLPFRSSFFALARTDKVRPLIQPVSVVFDQLNGLPASRSTRVVFAWYGDMDIASHFWRMAQNPALRVTVLLHEPVDPQDWPDRKAMSAVVWRTVAQGADRLRQNREPAPIRNG